MALTEPARQPIRTRARRDPAGAIRQPVPLLGLHQDRRGGDASCGGRRCLMRPQRPRRARSAPVRRGSKRGQGERPCALRRRHPPAGNAARSVADQPPCARAHRGLPTRRGARHPRRQGDRHRRRPERAARGRNHQGRIDGRARQGPLRRRAGRRGRRDRRRDRGAQRQRRSSVEYEPLKPVLTIDEALADGRADPARGVRRLRRRPSTAAAPATSSSQAPSPKAMSTRHSRSATFVVEGHLGNAGPAPSLHGDQRLPRRRRRGRQDHPARDLPVGPPRAAAGRRGAGRADGARARDRHSGRWRLRRQACLQHPLDRGLAGACRAPAGQAGSVAHAGLRGAALAAPGAHLDAHRRARATGRSSRAMSGSRSTAAPTPTRARPCWRSRC